MLSLEYILNPFVLAILVFFALSFIKLLSYLRKLSTQHAALDQLAYNYHQVERKQETDPQLIKRDLLQDVTEDTIAAQRVAELQWISARGGDVDQVALAEVLAAREAAKVSIARYVASVLVLVGLCGAIWGLSGLVVKMGPALRNVQEQLDENTPNANSGTATVVENKDKIAAVQASFAALVKTMSDSLTDTRSAFFASLTGILASVILLLLNWYVSSRQIDFLTELEDLTATKLIPIFKPVGETAQVADVVTAFRDGSEYMVRLSGVLDNKVSQVARSLDDLFVVVHKFSAAADSLEQHESRVHDAQEQMIGVVSQFMGLTSRIEAHQAGAHVDIEDVVKAVNETNNNLTRALENWQTRHEDLLQILERGAKQARFESKKVRELTENGIVKVAGMINSSMEEQLGQLRAQALELLQQQQVGAGNQLSELVNRQGEFVTSLQQSISDSNGHKELLAGLGATISQERVAFTEVLDKVQQQNEKALKALLIEQKRMFEASSVAETSVGPAGSGNTDFSAMMVRLETLGNHFTELSNTAARFGLILRILTGVAVVTIPVFAALAIVYILDLRPEDQVVRIGSLLVILAMVSMSTWFLRAKTKS